jgi:hypothetical protein
MSKWLNNLHQENSKLRNEITRLRSTLQNASYTLRSKSPERNSKSPNDSQKENYIKNLKKKIEIGLFSPGKLPKHTTIPNQKQLGTQIIKQKNSYTLENLKISGKDKKLIKSIDSSEYSIQPSKVLLESLKKNINTLSNNITYRDSFRSFQENVKINEKNPENRRLIDSFESYYESEEENLAKFGKCELSYIKYSEDHKKGSRRREKIMLEEIESLRRENSLLKSKIQSVSNKKTLKSTTTRGRTCSRISQKSSYMRSCRSLMSTRKKHCKKCDALLSKGFSTTLCIKHGPKNKKSLKY